MQPLAKYIRKNDFLTCVSFKSFESKNMATSGVPGFHSGTGSVSKQRFCSALSEEKIIESMHPKKVLSKVFRTHHYARLSLWISIIVLVCTAAFKQLFPAKQMLVFNKEVSSVLKTCWSYTCGWYTSCVFSFISIFLLYRKPADPACLFSFISIFLLYWKPVDPTHLVDTRLVF